MNSPDFGFLVVKELLLIICVTSRPVPRRLERSSCQEQDLDFGGCEWLPPHMRGGGKLSALTTLLRCNYHLHALDNSTAKPRLHLIEVVFLGGFFFTEI